MRRSIRILSFGMLTLALGTITACGLAVDDEARFERARQAYTNGDIADAVVDLKVLLQGDPDRVDARLLLGEALFRAGDLPGATKEIERGVELLRQASQSNGQGAQAPPNTDRELVEATGKLAGLQLALGDFAPAQANAEIVMAADPANVAGYVIASQAAYQSGDTATARSYSIRLLDRSPDNPLARAMLGFVDAREGAYPAAEEHFNAVLARQPNQAAVRLALTQLQLIMGKPADAIATLAPVLVAAPTDPRLHQLVDLMPLGNPDTRVRVSEVASEIEIASPTSPVPGLLRGRALLLAREYEAAAEQFQAAMAKEGGRYPLLGYYVAQRALGNQTVAQPALEQWMQANPNDQATGFVLAASYFDQGQNELARTLYERLVGAGDVGSPLVLNNLAWLYGEVNDPRAIETARQAHQLAPDNGAITDTLGWLLVKAGHHDEGILMLRLAVQQAPDSQEIAYHLATALAEVGEGDDAQRMIERILPGAALDASRELSPQGPAGPQ